MDAETTKGKWIGGLAEWVEHDIAYLSIAFTWKVDEAIEKAAMHSFLGRRVIAGGPGLFLPEMRKLMVPHAEIQQSFPDAVRFHNPLATRASRGCPVGCWFCTVPAMDGKEFTLLPEFPVRPILCDDNLSGLPIDYQKFIIDRYRKEGVELIDANSGFEPQTFTEEIYELWRDINRGPWRFAFDESKERTDVHRVMRMLQDLPSKRKRVYVLIGNEPFAECMQRISEVIEMGCEPYVQPLMKLNARERQPWVRFDWTERTLMDVTRWANKFVWRSVPFAEYDRGKRKSRAIVYDETQGLFV
jgi:hypothetical protein